MTIYDAITGELVGWVFPPFGQPWFSFELTHRNKRIMVFGLKTAESARHELMAWSLFLEAAE